MIRYIVITLYFTIVATSSSCNNQQGPVIVPKSTAKAINQIPIQKNGCGPASLINAYRFGSPRWNAATEKIEGDTDKEKFDFMVKYYGRIFSSYARATQRWDDRSGINSLDLTDMANDFQTRRKLRLPKLKHATHFIKYKENHQKLLISTHKHLKKSLQSGFPPLISIKRFAQRGSRWRQVYGHFIVLYEIPSTLAPGATSFRIRYIDPWGGGIKQGTVKIPEKTFFAVNYAAKKPSFKKSPTLTVDFPQSTLGRNLVKKNERSATILAASITP